eukprot:scaffold149527_cov30-Tisochrysis_lutea.AAC.1
MPRPFEFLIGGCSIAVCRIFDSTTSRVAVNVLPACITAGIRCSEYSSETSWWHIRREGHSRLLVHFLVVVLRNPLSPLLLPQLPAPARELLACRERDAVDFTPSHTFEGVHEHSAQPSNSSSPQLPGRALSLRLTAVRRGARA